MKKKGEDERGEGGTDLCCDLLERGWTISIGVVFPRCSCETTTDKTCSPHQLFHHIFTSFSSFVSISISKHLNTSCLSLEAPSTVLLMQGIHTHCFSPGSGRLALQVGGGVIEGQQHLYRGQMGGGGGCRTAVVIQRHTGHCSTSLTLGRQQEWRTTRILRGRLGQNSFKKLRLTF